MRKRLVALAVAFLIAAVGIGEASLWQRMHPIQSGTSSEFWAVSTSVWLAPHVQVLHGPATIRDGWCIYAVQGLHGQYLYRVPEPVAMADFAAVQSALAARSNAAQAGDYAAEGYKRWEAIPEATKRTPQALFDWITDALLAKIRASNPTYPEPERYTFEARDDFYRRIEKARYYWATCAFEVAWLASLIVFMAYPLWRGYTPGRFLLHWCAAPFLFLLPHWLGFAARTRAPWGPHGGILYPWLLWHASPSVPRAHWEWSLLREIPPILSPISHDIGGPITSLTGGATAGGPMLAMAASLGVALLVGAHHAIRWLQAHTQQEVRGFEVLPPKSQQAAERENGEPE